MVSLKFASLAILVLKTLDIEDGIAHRFTLQDLQSDRGEIDRCIAHLADVGLVRVDAAGVGAFDMIERVQG